MIIVQNITIYDGAKLIGRENIILGSNIIIDDFVFIHAKNKVYIGNYVHIGAFSSLSASEEIIFEDFSCISHGCRLFTACDDFTCHGFGNPTVPEIYRNLMKGPIKIGKFAVIGANSVILPGVTVGEGVTVGANSVISKDLEPWGVYLNNRRIRERDKLSVLKNYEEFLKK